MEHLLRKGIISCELYFKILVGGTIFLKSRFFLKSQFLKSWFYCNNVIPGSIALNETRTTKLHIVIFADEHFQSVNHLQIDTIKCFSRKKRLQGISTTVFSTQKFRPRTFQSQNIWLWTFQLWAFHPWAFRPWAFQP